MNLNYSSEVYFCGELLKMATWRRRGGASNTSRSADYQAVSTNEYETDDALLDNQFIAPPSKVPWSGLIFALILFIGGAVLLVVAFLLAMGMFGPTYGDRILPLTFIGSLMFIPGGYIVAIAYFAYTKRPGYSFEDIPDFG